MVLDVDEDLEDKDPVEESCAAPACEPQTTECNLESLATTYGKGVSRALLLSLLCNAALLIYAHLGLSGVILSSVERVSDETGNSSNNSTNTTGDGACSNDSDYERWYNENGSMNKSLESTYCATEYNNNGCLLDADCSSECFTKVWNYTPACASCFGPIPRCSFNDGCAFLCQQNNGLNADCQNCTYRCNQVFLNCTGFTFVNSSSTIRSLSAEDGSSVDGSITNEERCSLQQTGVDYKTVDKFYVVYRLKFFAAVKRAWTSNAKLLAFIVVIFSFLWPYVKNAIMCYLWYFPRLTGDNSIVCDHAEFHSHMRRRHLFMVWLKRLGKWSFVDVYIIILILVGLTLEISLSNGSVPLVLRGEPRPAIISFLTATIWSFIHLEVISGYHLKQYQSSSFSNQPVQSELNGRATSTAGNSRSKFIDAIKFHSSKQSTYECRSPILTRLLVLFLLTSTIAMFIVGSIYDVIRFTSYVTENATSGCIRAYNIYTIGTMLISNIFTFDNSAMAGVYSLFTCYMLFGVVFHLLVHCIHLISYVFDAIPPTPHLRLLCRIADIGWTFASVEVVLLSVFAVQVGPCTYLFAFWNLSTHPVAPCSFVTV
jgi:Paraquat-inducible protein A